MPFPFEVSFAEIQRDPEPFVDAVFGSLVSEFMVVAGFEMRSITVRRS